MSEPVVQSNSTTNLGKLLGLQCKSYLPGFIEHGKVDLVERCSTGYK